MTKNVSDIPDFGINPPIMPGDKIFDASSVGIIYSKMDPENPTKITDWMFRWKDKEIRVLGGDEGFFSQLNQVVDTNTGRDWGCIVGFYDFYIIKANDANNDVIVEGITSPYYLFSYSTRQFFNFQFLPCTYPKSSSTLFKDANVNNVWSGVAPEVNVKDSPSCRLLYVCQGFNIDSLEPKSNEGVGGFGFRYDFCCVQDVYDKDFKINLPFLNEKIKNCKRTSSGQKTYIVFCTVTPDIVNNVFLYAIKETTFLASKDLKKEDFIYYHTKLSYSHNYDMLDTQIAKLDIIVAPFFRDESNLGAYQMVIASAGDPSHIRKTLLENTLSKNKENIGDGPDIPDVPINVTASTVDMELLSISADGQFVSHDHISLTDRFGGPAHNRFGLYNIDLHYLRNPDNSSTIFFAGHHLVGIDENSPFEKQVPPYSNFEYYRIQMVHVDIDADARKLVLRSSEYNSVIELVNDPFTCKRYEIPLYHNTNNPDAPKLKNYLKDYLIASYPHSFALSCYPTYKAIDINNPSLGGLMGYDLHFRPIQVDALTTEMTEGPVPFGYQFIPASVHNGKYYVEWIAIVMNGPVPPPRVNPIKDICVTNVVFKNDTPDSNSYLFYTVGAFIYRGLDFYGESITVGNPSLSFKHDLHQMFALYKCPPHEDGIATTLPSLNISNLDNVVQGITKSTMSSWQASVNVDCSISGSLLGFFSGTVTGHYSRSWGDAKMHMSSDQKSVSIHISSTFSNIDGLHAYISDFYLWQYPIFCRKFSTDPVGFLTILIPNGFSDATLDTGDKDFYYVQDYQVGKILSYVDCQKIGFDDKNLWFRKEVLTCSADSSAGGSMVIYSKDNTEQKEDEETTDDMTNAGGSVTGGFLGATFSISGNYTKTKIDNSATSTTKSKSVSFSFHSGLVKDQEYEYTITPIVYSHKDEKILMIDYDVNLDGPGWKSHFQALDIMLMALYPFSENATLKSFTRSIRFIDQHDGTVDINVYLFNNSLNQSLNIIINIYQGMPVIIPKTDTSPESADFTRCKLLGTLNASPLGGAKRSVASLQGQKIPKNTVISLELYQDGIADLSKKHYWGAYPFDYFSSMSFLKQHGLLEALNKKKVN